MISVRLQIKKVRLGTDESSIGEKSSVKMLWTFQDLKDAPIIRPISLEFALGPQEVDLPLEVLKQILNLLV